MTNRHIPALDGLRTISVAAVLLYHSALTASGGFLAVSQFFTLSGFLVTTIILRQEDSGGLGLRDFWGRRYRRLMPASLLTLAAVVVFGFVLASREQIDALRESIPAALFQVVNWHFIVADVGYVDQFSSPSPIQHFWSLAIEEQFYLLIPVAIIGIHRLSTNPRVLFAVLGVAALASTAWMWFLFDDGADLTRVYFGTDTRASEMLLGCVLAIALHHRSQDLGPRGRRALGTLGAAAFAATTWAFFSVSLTDARLYQGGFLLYSALTCVVIYSLVEACGPLSQVLATRPLPAVGRLGYAIYLFHWPLMLVLTEARVGLRGWPLFGVQCVVTVALAAASARFVENPIRYGRPVGGNNRTTVGLVVAGAVVLVGSLALQWDTTESELAGLGESVDPPPAVDEAVTRVLVIADLNGAGVTADLARPPALDVVARLPFPCADDERSGCEIDAWSDAVATHDPDIVLFHVSGWDSAGPAEVRDQLEPGFEALVGRGATVVWARTFGENALALRDQPFIVAMTDLTARRADMRRLTNGEDLEAVRLDLEVYSRRAENDLPRVLVVGDSVAGTLGYGLESWGKSADTAVVWSAGVAGCGLTREGFTVDSSGREQPFDRACDGLEATWRQQMADFEPDAIVVLSNAADFRARRLDDWPAPQTPGTDQFDEWLIGEYTHTVDVLSESGAQVVWLHPLCALDIFDALTEPDGENPVDPDRIDHVNDVILPQVLRARPQLRTVDLRPYLCTPDGPIIEVEGVGTIRPDGVHFNTEGSLWLAETHGAEILEATQP